MDATHCSDCIYCFKDERSTDYRRPPIYFCRRKGSFFSRLYKIGEGTRIDPDGKVCEHFKSSEK